MYNELISNKVRTDIRVVLIAVAGWLESIGLDAVVTSILDEAGISRKSSTHKTGRAVDIRTRDFPEGVAKKLTDWVNETFSTGAYFEADHAMKVAINHNSGYGDHIHIQVAARPLIINVEGGEVLI